MVMKATALSRIGAPTSTRGSRAVFANKRLLRRPSGPRDDESERNTDECHHSAHPSGIMVRSLEWYSEVRGWRSERNWHSHQ